MGGVTSPNGLSTQSQLLFYDVEVGPVAPLNLKVMCPCKYLLER